MYLLELGDLEGSVGFTGLHLQGVDLHVPLLHLVLGVELLSEDSAGALVELLAERRQVVLAHSVHIGLGSNLHTSSCHWHVKCCLDTSTNHLVLHTIVQRNICGQ